VVCMLGSQTCGENPWHWSRGTGR